MKLKIIGTVSLFNPSPDNIENINKCSSYFDSFIAVDDSGTGAGICLASNILYLQNKENVGLCLTINRGISEAVKQDADWILILDQDSIFNKGILTVYRSYISTHSVENIALFAPQSNYDRHRRMAKSGFKNIRFAHLSGSLFNMKALKTVGLFDERLFIDGLKLVKGDWIAFVDSDDWCEFDLYERALEVAERDDSDIVIFDIYRNIGSGQKVVKEFKEEFVTDDRKIISQLQESALHISFAPYGGTWRQGFPWDKIFKRKLIEDNKLTYPTGIKADEDVIFCIQAFQFAKKVSYFSRPLYHYRLNNNSIGYKYTPDREKIDKDVFAKQFEIGKEYGLSKEYFDAVNARIIHVVVRLGWRSYFNPQYPGSLPERIGLMNKALQSDPIYTAFDTVDKKRLHLDEKVALISRHHNVWILYAISKFAFAYIGFKSKH